MTQDSHPSDGIVSFLRFLAGMWVLAGLIAAIWIWNVFGVIETPGSYYTGNESEYNSQGIALAIGVGFQSLLGGVLIFVFAHMMESVGRIELTVRAMLAERRTEKGADKRRDEDDEQSA